MKKIGFRKLLILSAIAGFAALAPWSLKKVEARFSHLKLTTVRPAMGQPYSVAISTDGSQVALMHQEYGGTGVTTDVIELRETHAGRPVGSLSLPTEHWEQKRQYFVRPSLRYCNGGRYIVAFSGADTIYVADAHTLQLRASIALPELRLPPLDIRFDCSVAGNLAVLASSDMQGTAAKIVDLNSGKEITDLVGSLQGRYQGDGIAVSPDGSKVAVATWYFGVGHTQPIAEVIDTRSKRSISALSLGDPVGREHELTFAGENALIIGERGCLLMRPCDLKPHERTLRVWAFGADGSVQTLRQPGAELYRCFGASADGNVVFGYSATESYCDSCNSGGGELMSKDARFTLWDRGSGRVLVRSPRLKVEEHTCLWFFNPFGSCVEYEQPPALQMSGNGKAVLAFWPEEILPGRKAHELEIFTQP
jgi:hypothetical protein